MESRRLLSRLGQRVEGFRGEREQAPARVLVVAERRRLHTVGQRGVEDFPLGQRFPRCAHLALL